MKERMKIAVVSDDGRTVARHFGRAPYYVVVTVEGEKVVAWETRPRALSHRHGSHHHGEHGHHGHGTGRHAAVRHAAMLEQIKDCDVVIAGGMGMGAYEALRQKGLEVVLTEVRSVEEAVRAYVNGGLVHREDRVHVH